MKRTRPAYKRVSKNISQLGNGIYRCRLMTNGIKLEKYENTLQGATTWVQALKNTRLIT